MAATGGATTQVPFEGSKKDFIAANVGATTEVPCEASRCQQRRYSAQIQPSLSLYHGDVESATVADSSTYYSDFFFLFIWSADDTPSFNCNLLCRITYFIADSRK
jgi:hypothetical protein